MFAETTLPSDITLFQVIITSKSRPRTKPLPFKPGANPPTRRGAPIWPLQKKIIARRRAGGGGGTREATTRHHENSHPPTTARDDGTAHARPLTASAKLPQNRRAANPRQATETRAKPRTGTRSERLTTTPARPGQAGRRQRAYLQNQGPARQNT